MRIKKILFILSMLLVFVCSAKATVWSADNIKMVHLQDRTKYVCDPDGLLSAEAISQADRFLDSLRRGCKVQVAFVVARRVENGDTYRMAQDLGNKYGVGDKDTRRGLVVVIAVDDKRYTIAPGQGLEGELTDVDCNHIAQAFIIPNMKSGNTDLAVVQTSQGLLTKIKTGKLTLQEDTEGEDMTAEDWFLIAVMLIVIFGIPFAYLLEWILLSLHVIKKPWFKKPKNNNRRNNKDDNFPPFIFFGGGGSHSGGGSVGGSFGGGSFGGGGSSGGW